MEISSDYTNRTEVVPQESTATGQTIRQGNENTATPAQSTAQNAAPDSSASDPTGGGREVTTSAPLGHKDIERMTEERLMEDPEYREAKEKYDLLKSIQKGLGQIDGAQGWRNDGVVELWDLEELMKRSDVPDGAKQAAAVLLNDPTLWRELAGTDNQVKLSDLAGLLTTLMGSLKGMKEAVKAEVKAEVAETNAANAATGTGGATGAQTTGNAAGAQSPEEAKKAEEAAKKAADAKAIMAEADQALPKPAPSQFSGLEGASENLNNMVGWAEAEMDRLTKLMGKTDDPAVLKQLEAKINQMSRRMQQMTALMNQIMTAMQNISKMYSDIAMNSVRNMR